MGVGAADPWWEADALTVIPGGRIGGGLLTDGAGDALAAWAGGAGACDGD